LFVLYALVTVLKGLEGGEIFDRGLERGLEKRTWEASDNAIWSGVRGSILDDRERELEQLANELIFKGFGVGSLKGMKYVVEYRGRFR
jgi:hypothetical protein